MSSWIEIPERNRVGDFDLSTLAVDQAYLNISSSVPTKLWVYELSSACVTCPYKKTVDDEVGQALRLQVDTLFPLKYRLRTDGTAQLVGEDQEDLFKFCDIDHNFGEFGVYNIHASGSPAAPKCDLTVAAEPVNIYLPMLLVVLVYLYLTGIKTLWYRYRRSKNKLALASTTQPIQSSPTSASSSLSTSNGNKSADSGTKTAKDGDPANQAQATETLSSSPISQANYRLRSLDVFRGLCIVLMMFVNDGGARYNFFQHNAWEGINVSELINPWFLWIMGVAIPIAIQSQVKRETPKMKIFKSITIRSIKYICMGLMFNSINGPINFGKNGNLRLPGLLQRIGVCYFLCSSLVLFTVNFNFPEPGASKLKASIQDVRAIWGPWIGILVMVLIHTLITFRLKVPGCPDGYFGPGGLHNNSAVKVSCVGGATGYLDQIIFTNKHLHQSILVRTIYDTDPYDPDGFLGTLTCIFQVWLGVQAGTTLLVFPRSSSRLKRLCIWALVTGGIGTLLCQAKVTGGWIPVNSRLWTLSFVLLASSLGQILFSVMYIVIDVKQWWIGSPFLEAGMNSILLYVGQVVFARYLPWHWSYGSMRTHFILLVEALWGIFLWVRIAIWLHWKKTYWKV